MSLESPYPPPNFTDISIRRGHAPPPNKFTGFWTEAQLEHNNISENFKKISRRNKTIIIASLKYSKFLFYCNKS